MRLRDQWAPPMIPPLPILPRWGRPRCRSHRAKVELKRRRKLFNLAVDRMFTKNQFLAAIR